MKSGDIVMCVDSSNCSSRLTMGKKYTLIRQSEDYTVLYLPVMWEMVLDDGKIGLMYIGRFIGLIEYRTHKIDELLK